MKINVKLVAGLEKFVPNINKDKTITLELPPGTKVQDIIKQLKISKENILVLINGAHGKLESEVKNEDLVILFPPVAGG